MSDIIGYDESRGADETVVAIGKIDRDTGLVLVDDIVYGDIAELMMGEMHPRSDALGPNPIKVF
ncbi:hypothetical protein [Thalassospira povalilytica]|uniref:hypothetical protein n=1 Tax=Thalassospira povalilytica TaxID=732237 RepID=UPI003AA9E17C